MNAKVLVFVVLLCSFGVSSAGSLLTYSEKRPYALGLSLGATGPGISVYSRERNMEFLVNSLKYSESIYADSVYSGSDAHLHARRFIKQGISGWYYGAFLHRTYLRGKLKGLPKNAEQKKTGLGLELGYSAFNLFNSRRLFWGLGLGTSYYLGAKETGIFENKALKNDADIGYFLDLRVGMIF